MNQANYILGRVYEKQNRKEEAKARYEAALKLASDFKEAKKVLEALNE